MNSWMSTLLSACAPPLRMFIIGTGRSAGVRDRRGSGRAAARRLSAAARAAAMDTPRIALAPSLALFGVPSRSIMSRSSAAWSSGVQPRTAGAIVVAHVARRPSGPPCRVALGASCRAARAPRGCRSRRPTAPRPARCAPSREKHVDLDRRVAARIEDFSGFHFNDFSHLNLRKGLVATGSPA